MFVTELDRNHLFLKPGEQYITHLPTYLTTVLGSCVGIILICNTQPLCGISHPMLPAQYENEPNLYKFVDYAFEKMWEFFYLKGIKPNQVDVKLFGGGNLISEHNKEKSIGNKNVLTALSIIKKYGFKVQVQETGNAYGLKLRLSMPEGEVILSRLPKFIQIRRED